MFHEHTDAVAAPFRWCKLCFHSAVSVAQLVEHRSVAQTFAIPFFWFQQLTFGFIRVIWVKWADLEPFAYRLCTTGQLMRSVGPVP